MQGKQLKRLASIASLAALDYAPASFYLTRGPEDKTLAWYYGTYFAGGVQVDSDEVPGPIPLAPEYFRATVSLFADKDEVGLQFRPTALDLTAGKKALSLAHTAQPTSGMETFAPIFARIPSVLINTKALLAELALVKNVAVKNLSAPILDGVRLFAINNRFGVQAANGTTLVYQAALNCRTTTPDRFEVIVPVEEMTACLNLFEEEEVGLAMDGRALVLCGVNAWARTMTKAGEWPKMPLTQIDFSEDLTLPATVVQSLVKAARALKAPDIVTIRPGEDGGIVLETQATESGQFQETVKGTAARAYGMLADDLDLATRIGGKTIALRLSPEKHMACLQTDDRRLYIVCRVI